MRVFITGASGHIGSAVVPELIQAGHQVIGLARSDRAAEALTSAGAEVQRGDLDDFDALASAASSADGVIHLAFKHDLMQAGQMEPAVAADLDAIRVLGDALAGSGKPLVGTSGSMMLAFGGIEGRSGTEDDILPGGGRIDAENAVIALADRDVRSSAVRLAPTVHSPLDGQGFIPALIAMARQNGYAGYVEDGQIGWRPTESVDDREAHHPLVDDSENGAAAGRQKLSVATGATTSAPYSSLVPIAVSRYSCCAV